MTKKSRREEKVEYEPKIKKISFIQQHPRLFWLIIIIALLFALNVGLVLPLGFLSIIYEIELAILQFFRIPIPMWLFLIFIILAAMFGIYLIPRIEIPDADEKYIYTSTWSDGKLRYFKTLGGMTLALNDAWCVKTGFLRYTMIGAVDNKEIDEKEKVILYESKNLEVTKSLIDREEMEHYKKKLAALEKDRKGDSIVLTVPQLIELMKEYRREEGK